MSERIVVLDGLTLNPGDLDWSPLKQLGELVVHDRTPAGMVVERAAGFGVALTNKTPISRDTIARLPGLRYVGVLATGYNVVDTAACRQRGVVVSNVPGYSTASVAQQVFALLLEVVNRVGAHDRAVHEGRWASCPDFSFTLGPIGELAGKTLGIVGLGAIGQRVAMIGSALGMEIAAAHQRSMDRVRLPGVAVDWMTTDDLFARSDVISLHCPLTEATRHLVNAARLATMKRSAVLINTGRGPLVDESALAGALRDGRIAGAAVDVLSCEPPSADNPLLSAPNCVITPHIAWASVEARQRLMRIAADNVRAFLDGRPTNVVG